MNTKYYVLQIWSKPEIYGPYKTAEDRDNVAREIYKPVGMGIFRVAIHKGDLILTEYPEEFFDPVSIRWDGDRWFYIKWDEEYEGTIEEYDSGGGRGLDSVEVQWDSDSPENWEEIEKAVIDSYDNR